MQLRPYQENAIEMIRQSFRKGNKRVICCAPTGAGKAIILSQICRDVYTKGGTPMVLVNRVELGNQAKDKFNKFGLYPNMIVAGKKIKSGSAYIASVQTLRRRELPEITLLIVDEAHLADFKPVILQYVEKGVPIIGFTATPVSTKRHDLSEMYQDLVQPIDILSLLDQQFLVPAVFYGAKEDLSDLVVDSTGEYSDKSQFAHFNTSKLYDGVIENYIKFANNTKALAFNVNVAHSKEMTLKFQEAGISSEHLDGTATPAERKRVLDRYAKGDIKVLNSVAILTTGFDAPDIGTVILNRATKSIALYLQMLGRGARISSGKTHFNVIDMGSNCFRLGFYDDVRQWSLVPKNKNKQEQPAPMKTCPSCESLIYSMQMRCKFCSYEWPESERELAQSEFVLIEKPKVVPDDLKGKSWTSMEVADLIRLQESMGYKQGWVIKICMQKGEKAVRELAAIKGYSSGWVWRTLNGKNK